MTEPDAFESVLDDLRELARQHPEVKSMLLRLLRAMRDVMRDAVSDGM
jgi:hypothetical protein